MRIGAVNYLNSKPLVYGLEDGGLGEGAGDARLSFDLPSRLADSLAAGRLDVALIPSVEFFRSADRVIVSDACVACRGPVLSVKLHFRTPPAEVCTLALDEGSRTSSALAQILLDELYGVRPATTPLPIGGSYADTDADAVLLIGDRAIQAAPEPLVEVWDLGERWCQWTGLPFVFAMWVARAEVEGLPSVATILSAARDQGVEHIDEIAAHEAAALGITTELAAGYLRDNLYFKLGAAEREALLRFYGLCVERGLAPANRETQLTSSIDGCTPSQPRTVG